MKKLQGINENQLGILYSMKNLKNKLSVHLLFILAIIGIAISIELTLIYYYANFVPNASPSFCAINNTIDCDAVAKTAYSRFFGLPTSVYGLVFYIAVLCLSIIPYIKNNWIRETFKNPKSYIFSLAIISLIVSIALAWISTTRIHKVCILCYVSYFINFFILLASKNEISVLSHLKITLKDFRDAITIPLNLILAIVLVIITGLTLGYLNYSNIFVANTAANSDDQDPFGLYFTPSKNIGNILGSKNPKLIIHEYTDFKCPFCAISNLMMQRLAQEVKDVQIIHHDYPLDTACNSMPKETVHPNSCLASQYSKASKLQGKYWDYNTLLFENQDNLSEANFQKFGKKLHLDVDKLKKDAHSAEIKAELKREVEQTNKKGITATPTYIIGKKKYVGLMPYPELKKIVLENLK